VCYWVKLELVARTKCEDLAQALADVVTLDGGTHQDDGPHDEITRDEGGREQRPRDRRSQ
jgi:hypothetical protein